MCDRHPIFTASSSPGGDDREIIDVVVDRVPQVDALKASVDGIRVDTLREILANKLSTMVSRSYAPGELHLPGGRRP